MKQYLSLLGVIVVLCVLAVGFSYLAKMHPAPATDTTEKSPILAGTLTESHDYSYIETTDGYEISAIYPAQVPLSTPEAGKKAALALEQGLATSITAFKTDAAQMLSAEEVQRLKDTGR